MIFRCEECSTGCFCDADGPDHWPSCQSCGDAMTPEEARP